MKIAVLIPSEAYRESAGVRIRYARIADALMRSGNELSLHDMGSFDVRHARCEVLLISKCYDARALVIAALAAKRGIIIGIDLFDDYFSQLDDSRLSRFRTWLRQILATAHFATASTEAMADVVRHYRADLAVHVVSDPVAEVNWLALPELLRDKRRDALSERMLRLCWFGMGDNPNFGVGLTDIAAFADALKALARTGLAVELNILTNPRSMTGPTLAMIASMPVQTLVSEWSQAAEARVLRESFAAFIPVNAQRFSIAKSLNRGTTALAAGCQVLNAGYPLYERFEEFVYRRPGELLSDLEGDSLRLSEDSLAELRSLFDEAASAAREASSLLAFLGLLPAVQSAEGPLLVLHGTRISEGAHDLVESSGGISIVGPFSTAIIDFDAVLRARSGAEAVLLVSRSALARVQSVARKAARTAVRIGRRRFWQIGGGDSDDAAFDWARPPLPLQLAMHERLMRSGLTQLDQAFGPAQVIVSEDSLLPFEAGL